MYIISVKWNKLFHLKQIEIRVFNYTFYCKIFLENFETIKQRCYKNKTKIDLENECIVFFMEHSMWIIIIIFLWVFFNKRFLSHLSWHGFLCKILWNT